MNDFFDNIDNIETKDIAPEKCELYKFRIKVNNRLVCKSGLGLLGCKNLIKRNLDSLVLKDSDIKYDVFMNMEDNDNEFIIGFVVTVKVTGKFCSLEDVANFIFALNNFNLQKDWFVISMSYDNKTYSIDGTNLIEDFNSLQTCISSSSREFENIASILLGDIYSRTEMNCLFAKIPQYIEKRELQFSMLLEKKIKKLYNKKELKRLPYSTMSEYLDFNVPYRINDAKKLRCLSILKEPVVSDNQNNKIYIFADTDDTIKKIDYMSTRFLNTSQIPYMWTSGSKICPVIKYVLDNISKLKKQTFKNRFCQFYITQEHYCHLSFLGGILYNRDMDQNIYVSIGMMGTPDFINSMIKKLFQL